MKIRTKRHGKVIGLALIGMLLWGVVAHWSWNIFAVDLLGLPEMAYRHALALGLLLLSVGGLLLIPFRSMGGGHASCR